jgi:hypothetical protein
VLAGLCIAPGCAKATDDVESSDCDASGPPKIIIGTEAGSGFEVFAPHRIEQRLPRRFNDTP